MYKHMNMLRRSLQCVDLVACEDVELWPHRCTEVKAVVNERVKIDGFGIIVGAPHLARNYVRNECGSQLLFGGGMVDKNLIIHLMMYNDGEYPYRLSVDSLVGHVCY